MLKLSGHSAALLPPEQHYASSSSSFTSSSCLSLLLFPPLTSGRININPDVNINVPSRRLSADQSGVPTASQRGATLLQVTVGSHYSHIKALFPCRHTLARSHACIKCRAIILCQGAPRGEQRHAAAAAAAPTNPDNPHFFNPAVGKTERKSS